VAVDPVDAAETLDQMPSLRHRPIESEIGKLRVYRTRRMVRHEATEEAGIGDGFGASD